MTPIQPSSLRANELDELFNLASSICREKKRFEAGILVAIVSKLRGTESWELLDDQKALFSLE